MHRESGFSHLVRDAVAFCTELSRNNTKKWFDANRERYKSSIKAPAEHFRDEVAAELAAMSGAPVTGKLFRANRDVRFSKDKRPYNEHLHLAWASGTVGMGAPTWFFGISPGYMTAGHGIFSLQKDMATRFREMVDEAGDELTSAIAASGATFSSHGPDPLKRVPAPYPADHPHAALLRRKSFTLEFDLQPALSKEGSDPLAHVLGAFERLLPISRVLEARL